MSLHFIEAGTAVHPDLNQSIGEWIAAQLSMQLGGNYALRDYSTLAVFNDNRLVAGFAYHDWHPQEAVIEMSGASIDRWLNAPVLKRLFGYPFHELGCQLVVWRVSERNTRLLEQARRIGFRLHRIERMLGRTEAGYVCTLTDDAWNQWLATHGQISAGTP